MGTLNFANLRLFLLDLVPGRVPVVSKVVVEILDGIVGPGVLLAEREHDCALGFGGTYI